MSGTVEETTRLLQPASDVVLEVGHAESSEQPSTLPAANRTAGDQTAVLLKPNHSASSGSGGTSVSIKDLELCKICLEEDAVSELEEPCGCTGTQKYAHHACIQRWVEEKGNVRCEICEQPYKGEYHVPPVASNEHSVQALGMFIQVEGDRVLHQNLERLDLWEDQQAMQHRNPCLSWCFTLIIFAMFLVVLHHTMYVTDAAEGTDDGSYVSSLALFLFWVLTKALLIGIPLYAVMKLGARQAQREQYESLFQAAAANRRMVLRAHVLGPAATDTRPPATGPERV